MDSPLPTQAALDWVARCSGASGANWMRTLHGGEHASTNVISTSEDTSFVIRQFPLGDDAVRRETLVLQALDGFAGFAPKFIAADTDGEELGVPTILTSLVPGVANIKPRSPDDFAEQLGQMLARIHAHPPKPGLRSIVARTTQHPELLEHWSRLLDGSLVLSHNDFWSGNTLWQGDQLTGVVDWSGAGVAPRGFDVSWARLDFVILFGETLSDVFTQSYERASGVRVAHLKLWDMFAGLQAEPNIESWAPNYQSLGRSDLGPTRLRRELDAWMAIVRNRV